MYAALEDGTAKKELELASKGHNTDVPTPQPLPFSLSP